MSGDLPEGQQPVNVASSWCSGVGGCHWASHMRGGASLYVKICTLCKRIDWDDLAEQVARVRADVAGAITADLQAARRAAAAPASMESLDRALRIVARHAVAPAESVVGAPTPISSPSDVAAPRDALTDQDFDDFNETIADRDCSTLDSACHSVWLHGKWRWLTSQMTTEEKEAFADAVDRAGDVLADGESRLPVDRWWREPVGALPEDEGTRQEGLINVEE